MLQAVLEILLHYLSPPNLTYIYLSMICHCSLWTHCKCTITSHIQRYHIDLLLQRWQHHAAHSLRYLHSYYMNVSWFPEIEERRYPMMCPFGHCPRRDMITGIRMGSNLVISSAIIILCLALKRLHHGVASLNSYSITASTQWKWQNLKQLMFIHRSHLVWSHSLLWIWQLHFLAASLKDCCIILLVQSQNSTNAWSFQSEWNTPLYWCCSVVGCHDFVN
jgi:hypothetical protein